MPPIWCTATFRGREGEARTEALLNSGSDVIVLPKSLAEKIGPEPVGEVEVELADGRSFMRETYEIEVEITGEETTQPRETKALATIEERDYPLIGTEAMRKLRINLDIVKGKISFA